MIVGTVVRINMPGHHTHGQLGEVRQYDYGSGWGKVWVEGEGRHYRDEHVVELDTEPVNVSHEISTGALKR